MSLVVALWGECGNPANDVVVFPAESGYLSPTVVLYRLKAAMGRERSASRPYGRAAHLPQPAPHVRQARLENGCSITWLSRHLGHKTTSVTTDTYGHWEAKTAKAEAMAGVFGV